MAKNIDPKELKTKSCADCAELVTMVSSAPMLFRFRLRLSVFNRPNF